MLPDEIKVADERVNALNLLSLEDNKQCESYATDKSNQSTGDVYFFRINPIGKADQNHDRYHV